MMLLRVWWIVSSACSSSCWLVAGVTQIHDGWFLFQRTPWNSGNARPLFLVFVCYAGHAVPTTRPWSLQTVERGSRVLFLKWRKAETHFCGRWRAERMPQEHIRQGHLWRRIVLLNSNKICISLRHETLQKRLHWIAHCHYSYKLASNAETSIEWRENADLEWNRYEWLLWYTLHVKPQKVHLSAKADLRIILERVENYRVMYFAVEQQKIANELWANSNSTLRNKLYLHV